MAGKLAIDRGWAINVGGGFHHCSANKGGGFCPYADITLLIKFLFHSGKGIKKAMIVDLDAHQVFICNACLFNVFIYILNYFCRVMDMNWIFWMTTMYT